MFLGADFPNGPCFSFVTTLHSGRQEKIGAPLPLAALTTAVVISGTGDKHYFPSNSLIMSVLPHGWLSKANPEPLTPAEGLCVQGRYTVRACVCVCVQRGKRKSYTLALSECNPLSQLLSAQSPFLFL